MSLEPNILRITLIANTALVRLDLSVSTLMDHEILHLPESFATDIACKRFLIPVYPLVDVEVIIAGNGLSTLVANDFSAGMSFHVSLDGILPKARIATNLAGVLLGTSLGIVNGHVKIKTALIGVAGFANLTNKRLFTSVTNGVTLEESSRWKSLVTLLATYVVRVGMMFFVLLDVGHASGLEVAVTTLVGLVLVLAGDVALAAVFRAEQLLTGFASVSHAVLATVWMA